MGGGKGFTLIEMVIVVTIIGILLATAVISASVWLPRYKVQVQTKQMYADFMNGRINAMQKNRTFFVTLGANQYAIYEDTYSAVTSTTSPDGDGVLQTGNDRRVLNTTTQYALVSSPSITGFNFTANGLVSLATTTVDIRCTSTANAATDCIELSLTRILTGKWNGTTSTCTVQ